jgi:hypothetical protein
VNREALGFRVSRGARPAIFRRQEITLLGPNIRITDIDAGGHMPRPVRKSNQNRYARRMVYLIRSNFGPKCSAC